MTLTPLGAAKAAFGSEPSDTPIIDRLGFWRSLAGLVIVVLVSLDVRPTEQAVGENVAAKPIVNALIMLFVVLPAVVIVLFVTRRSARRDLGWLDLGKKLGLWLITVGLPLVLFTEPELDLLRKYFLSVEFTDSGAVNWLLNVVEAVLIVWWFIYIGCGIFWAVRTYCFVGEFHPLLSPTLTGITVTVLSTIDFIGGNSNGLPHGLWLTIILVGLGTTLILAVAEYWKLVKIGFGWRTGAVQVPRRAQTSPDVGPPPQQYGYGPIGPGGPGVPPQQYGYGPTDPGGPATPPHRGSWQP